MPERTDTAEATGASIPRAEIAVFAHELRGALTVIAGYGDMLRRPLDEAERLQALDGIRRAVSRADSLCSDVLAGRRAGGVDEKRREPLGQRPAAPSSPRPPPVSASSAMGPRSRAFSPTSSRTPRSTLPPRQPSTSARGATTRSSSCRPS